MPSARKFGPESTGKRMAGAAQAIRAYPVPEGGLALFWLGNSGFAFKLGTGAVIYVDPLLSDCMERVNGWRRLQPPPFTPQEADCDLLLITHGHADHLDPDSLPAITRAMAGSVLAPPSCVRRMVELGVEPSRLVSVSPGERADYQGLSILPVKAYHMHPKNPQPDAVGFVLTYNGMSIYHAGDTAYTAEVRDSVLAAAPLRVALLPINGKRCCLTAEDAAFFAGDLQPEVLVPMHYGLFAENSGDPTELLLYLRRYGVPSDLMPLPFKGGLLLEGSTVRLASL